MKLVHVTTSDLSLRFLLREQLIAFRQAGFNVIGVSAPGPWVPELTRDGIPHVAVPALQRRWAPAADLRAFVALVRVFQRHRPVVVHTHTPKARILGRLAARAAGVPIVVNTFHGLYGMEGAARQWFFALLERVAARWSDFDFSQARSDLDTLHRRRIVSPSRSAYLGNGVNLQVFDPDRVDRARIRSALDIPPDAVVVGTVGRLVWEKGYRELFAVAEQLRQENPRTLFLVVGPDEPRKRDGIPAAVVEDLSRRAVARFLGMRTDMVEMYAAMDVFVLPSYREGFPRAAIEAAAMGKPLILTDLGGCREVVAEAANGYLFRPGDAPALLDLVRCLVGSGELRARFGSESRRRALAEFDERRVIARTLDVYRRLIEERRSRVVHASQESAAGG